MSIHYIVGGTLLLIISIILFIFFIVKSFNYSVTKYDYDALINITTIVHIINFLAYLAVLVYSALDNFRNTDIILSYAWWFFGLFFVCTIYNIRKTSLLFGILITAIQPFGIIMSFALYQYITKKIAIIKDDMSL